MSKLSLHDLTNLKLLLSVEGIGPGKIRNLLSEFKSIGTILAADSKSLQKVEGISTNLSGRIKAAAKAYPAALQDTEIELEKLNKLKGRIVTVWDKEYPGILKKIYDPPLLFYIIGELADEDDYSIAVVGTRMPTSYGKIQAERIAAELASQGITIVSGLARGIDSIAHAATLKSGGRTVAVTGSGLDVIYPSENRKLFHMISENGAVISEFPLGTKPDAVNFPKRNRIISGLALGCVVIETAETGGAMQTARLALDQNREVFAVPGNLGIRQSEGTNLLIQRGEAELIRSAEDILLELELKLKPILGKNISKPQIDLNIFEEKILSSISKEPLQIDKIASLTNLSTSDCLVHLLTLEFKGLVKQMPGKIFASV